MKKNIIVFIVAAIIFTGIGVYAGSRITAGEIEYKETTVEGALDNLYITANNSILTDMIIRQQSAAKTFSIADSVFYFDNYSAGDYTYFEITNKSVNAYADSCTFKGRLSSSNVYDDLIENQRYSISDYQYIYSHLIPVSTTDTANYARCYYDIHVYK